MSAAQLLVEREMLVFDLDGTLVDSGADIQHNLSLALADCGLDPAGAEGLSDLHSPLEGIVHSVLGARGVATAAAGAVVQAYRRRIASGRYERCQVYAGVVPFLEEARQRGRRMAICTNKIQAEALRMLGHFDLLKFFDLVVGCDSASEPKPHAAPLQMVLRALGGGPGDAVMVGDTHVDALCAANAGVDFVWHTPGYGRPSLVTAHPVAGRFDSFEDVWEGRIEA